MPTQPPSTLWVRIKSAMRHDPHKAGVLIALFAILLVLQVRLQMNRGQGTSVASAAPEARADNADGSMTGGPTGGDRPIKPQDLAAAMRDWSNAPSQPLSRNLFAVDLDHFPQDGTRTAPVVNAGGQGFWDELAKSMAYRADARKEQQILLENLQQQANQFRLQSTIMTNPPRAVVDGELVGEGDVVACGTGDARTVFRVLKIEPRRIEIERQGIRLEIQMK